MEEESDRTPIMLLAYAISNLLLALVGIIVWLSWPIPEITSRILLGPFIAFLVLFYLDWSINLIFYRHIRPKLVRKKRFTFAFLPFLVISFVSRFFIAGVTTGEIDDQTFLVGPIAIAISSIVFSVALYFLTKEPITIKVKIYFQVDMFIHWLVILVFLPPLVLPSFGINQIISHIAVLGLLLLKGIAIVFTAVTFFIWSRNLTVVEDIHYRDIEWPETTPSP